MVRKLLLLMTLTVICLAALATSAYAQAEDPPADFGQVGGAITFLVGAAVVFLPGARGVTWIVDRVRDALPDSISDNSRFTILWPLLALAVALAVCIGWQVNVVGGLLAQIPRFSGSGLNETAGQVLTAIGIAGAASSWHDRDRRAAGN